jgi:two-component system CheB/CheR fusion protein
MSKLKSKEQTAPSYVVALGSSAGGTEALLSFFENLPEINGLAFIVIQHLSPDFKSLMPELIKNHTTLAVHVIEDGTLIENRSIYLTPPKHNVLIKEGHFVLNLQKKRPEINYPIDILFESLAINYKDKAIAVVLSGTGADGANGVIKVSQSGGLVLAQSPDDAKFSGMPNSAIATDMVFKIQPVVELAHFISQFSVDSISTNAPSVDKVLSYNAEHEQIFALLFKQYKLDFNYYKVGTVFRRIERRCHTLKLHSLQEYIAYLQDDIEEQKLLYKDLLIRVTSFFRDPAAFHIIEKKIVPTLFEKHKQTSDDIRVWCAACSTGEEAYSIAILLYEYAEKHKLPLRIKIYATDIHTDFLKIASLGIYSKEAVESISKQRLEHYFVQHDNQYKIIKPIRDMLVFAPHNLLASPPFIKMDLITCRNFLIYVQPIMQQKILSLLHLGLNISGFLFLGPSESLGELNQFVEPISPTWNIYKKTAIQPPQLLFHSNTIPAFHHPAIAPQPIINLPRINDMIAPAGVLPTQAYLSLIKDFVPCGFIIDDSFKVLHVLGRGGDFIFYQDGVVKFDILSLILDALKSPLIASLYAAKKSKAPQFFSNIEVCDGAGQKEYVQLKINPIVINDVIQYYCISIEPNEGEVIRSHSKIEDESLSMIHALEDELYTTSESLRHSIEELEVTNEELLASNEELQSTNEELQSVNEVLYTANCEHQKKIEELRDAHVNIDNLLRSTEVGAVFVDKTMKIRMFTPGVARFFDFVEGDTARSIKSFNFRARFKELFEKIAWVIKKNQSFEKEIQDEQGQWYYLKIFPYLNNHQLDGAIITMTNINEITIAKLKLKTAEIKLQSALKSSHIGLWYKDYDIKVFEHDSNINKLFGLTKNQKIKNFARLLELIVDEDRAHVSQQLKDSADRQKPSHDFGVEFRVLHPDNTLHYIALNGHVYQDKKTKALYASGACWDITQIKNKESELQALTNRYNALLCATPDALIVSNKEGEIIFTNEGSTDMFGYERSELIGKKIEFLIPDRFRTQHTMHRQYFLNNPEIRAMGNGKSFPVKHKNGHEFFVEISLSPIESAEGMLVISTIRDVTKKKLLEEKLQHVAEHDSLTGLVNRPLFEDRIAKAIPLIKRQKSNMAVCFIDVDDFKKINDNSGHAMGDAVLCALAAHLKKHIRDEDTFARFGGDEFALLLMDINNKEDVTKLIKKLIDSFSNGFLIENVKIKVSVSMGIALYPEDGESALIEKADAAMYYAKKHGKNNFSFYDSKNVVYENKKK